MVVVGNDGIEAMRMLPEEVRRLVERTKFGRMVSERERKVWIQTQSKSNLGSLRRGEDGIVGSPPLP